MTHFSPRRSATALGSRRGMYTYTASTIINSQTLIDELIAFCLARKYNEVYLSVNNTVMADSALAPFISQLTAVNLKVEALCGTASWGTPAGLTNMTTFINTVKSYNASAASAEKFSALHLDVEPWIGTGEDYSWIDPLNDAYEAAAALLVGTDLKLACDQSGVKIRNGSISQRQRCVDAVDNVVLMQYENTLAQAISRTLEFTSGLTFDNDESFQVAIRSIDFSAPSAECFNAIDSSLMTTRGYNGFVIYEYAAEKAKGP